MSDKKSWLNASLAKKSVVDSVVDQITSAIIAGELKPGDKIPTELELCESFQVGRNSVREAIKVLEAFGVVYIKRSEGTFVSSSFNRRMLDPMLYGLILAGDSDDSIIELREVFDIVLMFVEIKKADEKDIYYINKQYTNQIKKHYGMTYFDTQKMFLRPSISFENYDIITNKKLFSFGQNFILPFGWIKEEYHEYIPQKKQYTEVQIKEKLQKKLQKQMAESFTSDVEIIEQEVTFEKYNNTIKAKATIAVVESIGKEERITIPERRTILDGTNGENNSYW